MRLVPRVTENPILWQPSQRRIDESAMWRFMQSQSQCNGSYARLHDWSVTEPDEFWQTLAEFLELPFANPRSTVLQQPGDMTTARWFDGASLNYAEQLLRREGDHPAVIFRGESGSRRELSFNELRASAAGFAAALRESGVVSGDRVCGLLPNCPEAIIAMLGTASIGATWSSCSPDFGVSGVVDRFGQIEPKVLVCADGYYYAGKRFDSAAVVNGVLKHVSSIRKTVVVPFAGGNTSGPGWIRWEDFLQSGAQPDFESLPFNHPLYIMYSSGTTGVPKCIVHSAGGTLLQHMKEQVLHCDLRPGDRLFYFTTCGWMMWNWLASGLAAGATLVLFDGAPFHDNGRILWSLAESERITHFGTSAKYIAAQEKAGISPAEGFDLSSMRVLLSTGSPLAPASFDYVYRNIAPDVQLSSIAGGTDIISCFAIGNPVLPVRQGEIQCIGLGMAATVYNDEGVEVVCENGELVCTRAFPSMPLGFWNDPDNKKYHAAYFERFPGVWAHGDYAELTGNGGLVIHGRSDAVLNPGGVRIGTAEIYRQVEKMDEVVESIAIGQRWSDDERVILFVVLREGRILDDALRAEIRQQIREHTTPRHVPAKILAVPDIPRTISGKIVEIAVRSVVHGESVRNLDALANPDALRYFGDRKELQSE